MEGKTKKPMHRGHNEGNIRQRTDGRWEVRLSAGIDYKTGKPKRTSTCCNTKQEAIAILQEQAHDIRVNGWRDPMSVTLGEWYEYWLVTYMKDKVKQSTYMSYRGYGNKHFCVLYKIRLKKLEGRILQNPVTVVTGFDRPNLFFRVVKRKGGKETDNSILNYVKRHEDESGIIYCATKKNVDSVCELLLQHGILAGRYHAGLSLEERKESQDDFTYDRIRVMVATNAFGMGIDKSNVRYVLHYNMPQSLEYYYQEAGRAGRDGEEAECVLFFSKQDIMINKRLLDYKATEGGYTAGDPAVRANEQRKLNQMIHYCETDECLRQYILNYFGDHSPCICEKCSNCVVTEDEAEENYIETGRAKKKTAELADLTEEGQELFEKLRKCRSELAAKQGVPPFIICSDKTLKDMCARCPADKTQMADVYGMGAQKIASYGESFAEIIRMFLQTHESGNMTTGKTEGAAVVETVSKPPAGKKKQPFYIAPEKLDQVTFSDACMVSELTDRINALCEEKDRKKLTAAFVNDLLVQKGYLKEEEQDETRIRRVTEKGIAAGICEEERRSKFGGGHYYALIHTRESQEMIVAELKAYFTDFPSGSAPAEP